MAGTIVMAKAPPTMLIRYRPPAILASWRGEVPSTESIKDLPQLLNDIGSTAGRRLEHSSQAGATSPPLRWAPPLRRRPDPQLTLQVSGRRSKTVLSRLSRTRRRPGERAAVGLG